MAPRPVHALLAATALAGVPLLTMPLVFAQDGGESPARVEPSAVPALPPAPPPLPAAEAPPPESPLRAAPSAVPTPWQPEPQYRRAEPPRKFDQQIHALERDRIITPNERVRVRGTIIEPGRPAVEIACRNGALSMRECGGVPLVVGRSRRDGEVFGPLGSAGSAAAGSAGFDFGGRGEGFSTAAAPLPPISVPVTALLSGAGGNFRLTDVFGRTPRPAAVGGNGNLRLLYPLIGSAVTSSEFGWRQHPVLGSWLMHAGKDLAAPEGTPVVASLSGRVVMSGLAGGYGLAVEIEHDGPRRRTLYGHLSELYVREGQRVRQGEVIGRVGSTGLSTGPHLHFELRVPQDGGWVAVDPGDLDPGSGPGGSMVAGGLNGLGTLSGPGNGAPPDAVAMLMGQLIQTLERPRSPLAPSATAPAGQPAAVPLPAQKELPAPAPLPAAPPRG
jgi:hypothetical protein